MKLLLIDDNLDSLNMLANALELMDFECRSYISPAEAVKAFITTQFDAVITEYMMTGMNGLEVLESLKEIRPDVKVFIYTAYIHEKIYNKALEKGVSGFFIKPIDHDCLVESLEEIESINSQRSMRIS